MEKTKTNIAELFYNNPLVSVTSGFQKFLEQLPDNEIILHQPMIAENPTYRTGMNILKDFGSPIIRDVQEVIEEISWIIENQEYQDRLTTVWFSKLNEIVIEVGIFSVRKKYYCGTAKPTDTVNWSPGTRFGVV